MRLYQKSKRDKNHGLITECLKKLGATVIDLSAVGDGCPDVVVGFRGKSHLAEIKAAKGKRSPGQLALSIWWKGEKIYLLRDELDCMDMLYKENRP